MKNIYVLPTDKQSRLVIDIIENKLYLQPILHEKTVNVLTQNIYITSDEEIKEGDYIYRDSGIVFKITKEFLEYYESIKDKDTYKRYKIILTTDEDLIKDGVQAIDDEFLEWFVKNPTCEFVEVDRDEREVGNHLGGVVIEYGDYKIIIPQEKPKQETLEEVAERETTFPKMCYPNTASERIAKNNFIKGAKWQQEQILDFLYEEITERRDYSASKMCEKVIEFIQQFKNK